MRKAEIQKKHPEWTKEECEEWIKNVMGRDDIVMPQVKYDTNEVISEVISDVYKTYREIVKHEKNSKNT